jgi:exodeoxyribonuclease-3
MRIATYNVNGVNGRLPVLLRWLEEYRPDIACLQELKAPDERFPEQPIRDLGYDVVWHGQKSWKRCRCPQPRGRNPRIASRAAGRSHR